jgi:L-rhamnose mutarotase
MPISSSIKSWFKTGWSKTNAATKISNPKKQTVHMNRYCLAVDLKDDDELIGEYVRLHKQVSPEIKASITDAGIRVMDIYRTGNRMFMIIETDDDFSFEKKDAMDRANPLVQEWENRVWKYQQALPHAKPGEKWVLMEKIFEL